jgi:hypothetical protein
MAMAEAIDWLIFVLMIAVPAVLVLLSERRRKREIDPTTFRVIVGLHAIRRRMEVAQFRTELRQDAARLRRELRDELQQDALRPKRQGR